MAIKLKKKKKKSTKKYTYTIPLKSFEHPVDIGQTYLFTIKTTQSLCIRLFSEYEIDGRSKLFLRHRTRIYTHVYTESFTFARVYIFVILFLSNTENNGLCNKEPAHRWCTNIIRKL